MLHNKKFDKVPKGAVTLAALAKKLGMTLSLLGQEIASGAHQGVSKKIGINPKGYQTPYLLASEADTILKAHEGIVISTKFIEGIPRDTRLKKTALTFLRHLPPSHELRRKINLPKAMQFGNPTYFAVKEKPLLEQFLEQFHPAEKLAKKLNMTEEETLQLLRAGAWPNMPWGEVSTDERAPIAFVHQSMLYTPPLPVQIKDEHKTRQKEPIIAVREVPETHMPFKQALDLIHNLNAFQALTQAAKLEKGEIITDSSGNQHILRAIVHKLIVENEPEQTPIVARYSNMRKLDFEDAQANSDALQLFNKICGTRWEQQRVLDAIKQLSNQGARQEANAAKHSFVRLLNTAGGPQSPAGEHAINKINLEHINASRPAKPFEPKPEGISSEKLQHLNNAFRLACAAPSQMMGAQRKDEKTELTPEQRRLAVLKFTLGNEFTPVYFENHPKIKEGAKKVVKPQVNAKPRKLKARPKE